MRNKILLILCFFPLGFTGHSQTSDLRQGASTQKNRPGLNWLNTPLPIIIRMPG